MLALAVFSTAFYAALAALTGGVASPLFHWMLALPVAIAVVIQDHPAAIVGSGLAMLAGRAGNPDRRRHQPRALLAVGGNGGDHGAAGGLHLRVLRAAARAGGRAPPRRGRGRIPGRVPPRRRSQPVTSSWPSPRTSCARPLTSLLLQIDAVERAVSLTPGGVLGEVERQRIGSHRAAGEPAVGPHRRDARHVAPDRRPPRAELRSGRSGGAGRARWRSVLRPTPRRPPAR